MIDFNTYLETRTNRLNHFMESILSVLPKSTLQEAMWYSMMNGGKRVRPILVYAIGEMLGASLESLDIPAAAIECMHTFSLIHDDLPAMDNDDLRRGKPSCHKAFTEAIAILAGDALQTFCFEILTTPSKFLTSQQQLNMAYTIAKASGAAGMGYGQMLDIANQEILTVEQLNHLYDEKTGKILEASVRVGIIAAHCEDQILIDRLIDFSHNIGRAFQIHDDILDIEGNSAILGKLAGSDEKLNKVTYPKLIGINAAKEKVQTLYQDAIKALAVFPEKSTLVELTNYLTKRNY